MADQRPRRRLDTDVGRDGVGFIKDLKGTLWSSQTPLRTRVGFDDNYGPVLIDLVLPKSPS